MTNPDEIDDAAAIEALHRIRRTARRQSYRTAQYRRKRVVSEADLDDESNPPPSRPGFGWVGSGAHPSRKDPQALTDLAQRFIALRGWQEEVGAGAVLRNWETIVGKNVAEHCRVESLADGVLTIRTSSTSWATQMRFLQATILQRLNEHAGAGVVEEIVIVGPVAPSWKKGPRVVKGRGPRDTYG
ncbi:MAG: DciA family protein [Bowdeniella nasicola]|nr:DciA family protein [Bowdeniella nasicola]